MKKISKVKEVFTNSKKLKYGSSALVFTAVFVIFILLVNVVFSWIDNITGGKYTYIDMTSKQIYSVGDQSKQALKDVTQPIEIIFASPKDIVESSSLSNDVHTLCENYASTYDNISVSYHDVISEVAYFNKFKTTSADEITSASLIVYCPSTGLSKIFSLYEGNGYFSDMYKYASSGNGSYRRFAFDGENKLTNAFLFVTGNNGSTLKAGFISGHNEDINENLKVFLEDHSYKVDTVDLKKTTREKLAEYDLLIVCAPGRDYSGRSSGGVNEIELLRDYIVEDFGNLMFFTGYSSADMPELFSLVEESFGVKVSNHIAVFEGSSSSIPGSNGLAFLGSYSSENSGLGYSIHKPLSSTSSGASSLFMACSALEIVDKEDNSIEVSPVIVTSKDATASTDGRTFASWQNMPLMTVTRYAKLISGKEYTADVLVVSSSDFLTFLSDPSFSNSDLLSSALSQMNGGASGTVIDFKVLDESAITVTKEVQDGLSRKLTLVVPIIIVIIGTVVFIKRKYL